MKIPAPKNLRQTFLLFQLYRPEIGIASMVDAVDWTGVTPCQIYAAVLGRLPEAIGILLQPEGYDPKKHFIEAIGSLEFQEQLIRNFAKAFHEKQEFYLSTYPNVLAQI